VKTHAAVVKLSSCVAIFVGGLLVLSSVSGFDFQKSRSLPLEAAVLLSPQGYLQFGLRQFRSQTGRFDAVFAKAAHPRVDPSTPFPWQVAVACYFAIAASAGAALFMLRRF
jgi:hypothetical protein